MLLKIEVRHVQHVELEIDLSKNQLTGIVGKNGVGKTTLIRAIRNLSLADTFIRTASPEIFVPESSITYTIDGKVIEFGYDRALRSLNSKALVPDTIRRMCVAELPMPHGSRFNFFRTLSDADADIRRQIVLEEYTSPEELIDFLSDIYSSKKFRLLVETRVQDRSYYSILLSANRYVREDYLSSGEYFLISLYRTIKSGARLIAIDEIDLSLDAAAQVHLLRRLREFCQQYGCNILFTTHSLAMMRTLASNELLYMDRQGDAVQFIPASYHYVRSLLFGFVGWDRYILTEDWVLQEFIQFIIQRYCPNVFYCFKIIYIGGGSQVADLLRRNSQEQFLSDPEQVIGVLDGDQRDTPHARDPQIFCLPIDSVEKALFACYNNDADFPHRLPDGRVPSGSRDLFNALQQTGAMSKAQIYAYLCGRNETSLQTLIAVLGRFLSRP
jgi:ABC-type nitrate/sulfonate/bicarbonate transport system ATPase subunit